MKMENKKTTVEKFEDFFTSDKYKDTVIELLKNDSDESLIVDYSDLEMMYADVADYHTEHFGTSATGLIFSSGTMSQKFGTAISGSLIALFLGWAGANMITDDMGNTMIDPASVTDSVLTMVWSLFSLFPAVIAFLLMVLSWKFPIKK